MAPDETFPDSRRNSEPVAVPARPHLFLVIEGERPRGGSARVGLAGLDEVALGRADDRALRREGRRVSIGLPDRRMSTEHALIARERGGFVLTDRGSRNGTWVNGERVTSSALADGDLVEVGRTFFRFRDALPTPDGTPDDADAGALADTPVGLRTLSPALGAALGNVGRVAASKVPIVVTGATGSGKELVARAIHALSRRRGAFVAVNCAALPEGLLESQLFGHVRGAFSGAVRDEPGYVRSADGGTLFLDEIADLAAASQAALLRVLQESEVTPVGATRPERVDLRVLCATHGDLDALAVRGRFRLDLLARLAGMRVELPPLSERVDELGLLIAQILGDDGDDITFEPDAIVALLGHAWPMNLRELTQCLGLARALAGAGPIGLGHLPEWVRSPRASAEPLASSAPREPLPDDDTLRERLIAALTEHRGNVSAVARALGKARMQIQRWMKRFDLDPRSFEKP